MNVINVIGWIGALCFGVCAVPQALQCVRQKHSNGVSSLFLWLWMSGEVMTGIYVISEHGWAWPLLSNYIANLMMIGVILRYKLWPNR